MEIVVVKIYFNLIRYISSIDIILGIKLELSLLSKNKEPNKSEANYEYELLTSSSTNKILYKN